jgi:hypothetical protein
MLLDTIISNVTTLEEAQITTCINTNFPHAKYCNNIYGLYPPSRNLKFLYLSDVTINKVYYSYIYTMHSQMV